MNDKTIKMLKRYARVSGKNEKDVKKWWLSLDWRQRTSERKRILREVEKQG